MDKSHKDPDVIDLNVPRHAQYLHNAWKRRSRRGFLGWYWSCNSERIDILSDSIEWNHILQGTLPAYCIPKVVRIEDWRSLTRKSLHVTSASAKDLFEARIKKRIMFRTRSTIRSWAAILKFPIEPTNSKSNSWANGETRYHAWRDHCVR